jgi:integrase
MLSGGRRLAVVSAKTVANDLDELSPIWHWAKTNRKLSGDNPFTGLAPRVPRTSRRPRVPFTDDEARRILHAARSMRGLLRWLPWVLCFTGARLGEVCQAVKEDVRRDDADGPWLIHLHAEGEGRTLRTPQANA